MSNRKRIAIIDSVNNSYVADVSVENDLLGEQYQVELLKVRDLDALLSMSTLASYDGIISWHLVPLPAIAIDALKNSKIIVRAAVGFDNIDIVHAANAGVSVCNVPDYGTEEVADHTLALFLSLVRNIHGTSHHVANGEWEWSNIGSTSRIRELKFGIIGFGRIGGAVALRAKALGMQVSFYDPYAVSGIEKTLGVARHEELASLLAGNDVISIHCPLNAETKDLLGHEQFSLMQRKPILLNTARGGIVNTDALITALEGGAIRSAGLDVLAEEPIIPSILRQRENVIMTPHSAFYSDSAIHDIRTRSALKIKAYFENKPLRDVVNSAYL